MNWDSPSVQIIREELRRLLNAVRQKNAKASPRNQKTLSVHWSNALGAFVLKAIAPWIKRCRLKGIDAKNVSGFIDRIRPETGPEPILALIDEYFSWNRIALKRDERAELTDICNVVTACWKVCYLLVNNSVIVQNREELQKLTLRTPARIEWLEDAVVAELLRYIGFVFQEDLDQFRSLEDEIEKTLGPLREEFQRRLNTVAFNVYPDYATKRAVAVAIQDVADRLRVAFKCPECGDPARLKCVMTGTAKTGVVSFGHSQTTHRGKTTMPALEIVPLPPDKRKTRAEEKSDDGD